jgi:hypothetical protein
MVGFALIFLSFLAAVVGTATEANRTVKASIIVIATITAMASAWLYHQDNLENELNKKLIAGLVQSTQDDRQFSEDLRIAINTLLEPKGQAVSDATFADHGLLFGISNTQDETFAGAIHISQRQMRPVRYALIAENGLAGALSGPVLEDVWTTDTIEQKWNVAAPNMARVAIHTIDNFMVQDVEYEMSFPNGSTVEINVVSLFGERLFQVRLSEQDIAKLVGKMPIERGGMISELVSTQIIEQL